MIPPHVVLDASVVIKWFRSRNEPNLKTAQQYRRAHLNGKIRIAVPELLYYEVLNALATKPNTTPPQLIKAADLLEQINLDRYPLSGTLNDKSIQLQQAYNISFYDASYLAVASHLETDLITADLELSQKVNLAWVKPLS